MNLPASDKSRFAVLTNPVRRLVGQRSKAVASPRKDAKFALTDAIVSPPSHPAPEVESEIISAFQLQHLHLPTAVELASRRAVTGGRGALWLSAVALASLVGLGAWFGAAASDVTTVAAATNDVASAPSPQRAPPPASVTSLPVASGLVALSTLQTPTGRTGPTPGFISVPPPVSVPTDVQRVNAAVPPRQRFTEARPIANPNTSAITEPNAMGTPMNPAVASDPKQPDVALTASSADAIASEHRTIPLTKPSPILSAGDGPRVYRMRPAAPSPSGPSTSAPSNSAPSISAAPVPAP